MIFQYFSVRMIRMLFILNLIPKVLLPALLSDGGLV